MEGIRTIVNNGTFGSDEQKAVVNAGRRDAYSQQDNTAVNLARTDAYANLSESAKADLLGKRKAAASAHSNQLPLQEKDKVREAARIRKAKSIAEETPGHRIDRLDQKRPASQAYRDTKAQLGQDCIAANQTAVYQEFFDEQRCRMRNAIDDGPCTEHLCQRIANAALALVFHRFAFDFTNSLGNFSESDM